MQVLRPKEKKLYNLPLTEQIYAATANQGVFGVLADAGAGMGVGALMFSLSQNSSQPKLNKNTLGDLANLLNSNDQILSNNTHNAEAKPLLLVV